LRALQQSASLLNPPTCKRPPLTPSILPTRQPCRPHPRTRRSTRRSTRSRRRPASGGPRDDRARRRRQAGTPDRERHRRGRGQLAQHPDLGAVDVLASHGRPPVRLDLGASLGRAGCPGLRARTHRRCLRHDGPNTRERGASSSGRWLPAADSRAVHSSGRSAVLTLALASPCRFTEYVVLGEWPVALHCRRACVRLSPGLTPATLSPPARSSDPRLSQLVRDSRDGRRGHLHGCHRPVGPLHVARPLAVLHGVSRWRCASSLPTHPPADPLTTWPSSATHNAATSPTSPTGSLARSASSGMRPSRASPS
jgi:hypothetical protein